MKTFKSLEKRAFISRYALVISAIVAITATIENQSSLAWFFCGTSIILLFYCLTDWLAASARKKDYATAEYLFETMNKLAKQRKLRSYLIKLLLKMPGPTVTDISRRLSKRNREAFIRIISRRIEALEGLTNGLPNPIHYELPDAVLDDFCKKFNALEQLTELRESLKKS
jgi:hypothetical protein